MLPSKSETLWQVLSENSDLGDRSLFGSGAIASWNQLAGGSCLGDGGEKLRGKSVLVATTDQLQTIAALVELDGVASRLVLYPPDLSVKHLAYCARIAEADAIVSDRLPLSPDLPIEGCALIVPGDLQPPSIPLDREQPRQTEWVLLTSGTTGNPKLVVHTLASLTGAIEYGKPAASGVTWSTFYDIRRYGGLQIFLRAALTGTSLVLSSAQESTAQFLARAGARGVTHISGTPSHWRRALMSSSAHLMAPDYVRLSGEIADQPLLDQLRSFYPQARVSHAFASTEAGVAFNIKDTLSGLDPDVIKHTPGVEMKIEYGTLRIRSDRTASCYLNHECRPLKDKDGFVDTGDVLELRGNRYYFVGRRDGVINVGGLKVHPEEVEAVINRHPHVRMSLVRTRKNPIMGSLVIADVVLEVAQQTGSTDDHTIQRDILSLCRESLSAHKVPVSINFVPTLAVAETGKLIRRHA
jgi:acyl-coenzyme A synthetase/AMP-(fatty) acid ligase